MHVLDAPFIIREIYCTGMVSATHKRDPLLFTDNEALIGNCIGFRYHFPKSAVNFSTCLNKTQYCKQINQAILQTNIKQIICLIFFVMNVIHCFYVQ